MAINKNHEFEELDGIKCAVVERNLPQPRVDFLQSLLEYNHYKVVVVASPPPKVTAAVPDTVQPAAPTYTLGVTDVMFNATNAVFGRLLRTPDDHVVTLAYWQQKEAVAKDDVPYFESDANKNGA